MHRLAGGGAPIWEIAGPREESLVEMATLLVTRRGDPVRIEGVSNPADPDRDLNENGGLLPGPDATPLRRAHRSRTRSPRGCEQQMSARPVPGASTGSGE